jgi:replicative DNA helicase
MNFNNLVDESLERATLATMILTAGYSPDEIASVPAEVFASGFHRHISAAVSALALQRIAPDYFDVQAELQRRGVNCEISRLTSLADGIVPLNLQKRVAQLSELHWRREAARLGEELIIRACDLSTPIAEIAAEVRERL